MVYTNRVTWDQVRSLDTSTMSSSSTYYNIGTSLTYPAYKVRFVNNSNQDVTISIDGTNGYDFVPKGTSVVYDTTQAQLSTADMPAVPIGTQFSAKAASAGTGLLYVIVQYIVQA